MPTPIYRLPPELVLRIVKNYYRPTEAIAIFLTLRLVSRAFRDLIDDNTLWNPYLMKGKRTHVPGQAIRIFFEHPEYRLPYYRLLGRSGKNHLSERVGDMLEIRPELESQVIIVPSIYSLEMQALRPEGSEFRDYIAAYDVSWPTSRTFTYESLEWRQLLVSELITLVDLNQITGPQFFKLNSSPLQHLVATQQLSRRAANNLPARMHYVLKVLANLLVVENNEIDWEKIQQLTPFKIGLLMKPEIQALIDKIGINKVLFQPERFDLFKLSHIAILVRERLISYTDILHSFSEEQIDNLRHERPWFNVINNITTNFTRENFWTFKEFLNLTRAELDKVLSAIPWLQTERLTKDEVLSLTEEQCEKLRNGDVRSLSSRLTSQQIFDLSPEQLHKISDRTINELIEKGYLSFDEAMSLPDLAVKQYMVIFALADIMHEPQQYLSFKYARALSNDECENFIWMVRLHWSLNPNLIFESHQADILSITKALTPAQKAFIEAEVHNKRPDISLETVLLNLKLSYSPEAPTPSQLTSSPVAS